MAEQWKCYTKPFWDTWVHLLHSDVNLQVSDGTIPGLFLRYSAATRNIRFFLGCKPGSHLRTHFLINRLSFFWQTIFAAFVLTGGNQETFVNQCDKQLAYALWRLARYRNCVRSSNITHRT